MKKLKVLSMAAVAAGMVLLTSCLDGGKNESSGSVIGVLGSATADYKTVIYGVDGGTYYISGLQSDLNFETGDCVGAYGSINYDSPENANFASKGYLIMNSNQYWKYDKYNAHSLSTSDTTTTNLPKGEMNISTISGTGYVKQYLFLSVDIPVIQADQKSEFQMAYDMENVSTVEGKRVYEFYVRGSKTANGKEATQSGTLIVPFNTGRFFDYANNTEKGKNEKSVNIRFNVMKEFNKDTTAVVWAKSQVFSFAIPEDSKN